MKRRYYHKLIRDKIPDIIKRRNATPKTSLLDATRFRKALKEKLIEEAQEVLKEEAQKNILDELADVLQLTESIAKDYGIPFRIVEKKKKQKRRERGGFEKRLFLEYIDEP